MELPTLCEYLATVALWDPQEEGWDDKALLGLGESNGGVAGVGFGKPSMER